MSLVSQNIGRDDQAMRLPELLGYVCDLYQQPGIAETVSMDHIKNHYYGSHASINPTGIVPKGPEINFFTFAKLYEVH